MPPEDSQTNYEEHWFEEPIGETWHIWKIWWMAPAALYGVWFWYSLVTAFVDLMIGLFT